PDAAWCGLTEAGDAGLALRTLEPAPTGGAGSGLTSVEVTNIGSRSVELVLEPVIALEIDGSAGRTAGGAPEPFALAPGASAVLDAPTAVLPAGLCGDGTPSADVPIVIVLPVGGEPIAVVGSPFE